MASRLINLNSNSNIITSLANGRVGINTTAPNGVLSLVGGPQDSGFLGGLVSPDACRQYYSSDGTGWRMQIGYLHPTSLVYSPQITLLDNGCIGFGTQAPTAAIDIGGTMRKALDSAPVSSSAAGNQGDLRFCADGIYFWIANNTCRRILWQNF